MTQDVGKEIYLCEKTVLSPSRLTMYVGMILSSSMLAYLHTLPKGGYPSEDILILAFFHAMMWLLGDAVFRDAALRWAVVVFAGIHLSCSAVVWADVIRSRCATPLIGPLMLNLCVVAVIMFVWLVGRISSFIAAPKSIPLESLDR